MAAHTGAAAPTTPSARALKTAQPPPAQAGRLATATGTGRRVWLIAGAAGLLGALLWSYWATARDLWAFWMRNQDYSAGLLVPLAVVYFVWADRAWLRRAPLQTCWWGGALILLAELVRLFALYYGYGSGERYALVVALVGLVLLVAGWRIFWRLRWKLALLFLMVPLPARVHEAVTLPLQEYATRSAVLTLETLGFFVRREGHVLRLDNGVTVAVAEACSGLRMLTAFVFVAALLALMVSRPRWQKVVLLAASVPIAVLSNAVRVFVTSLFMYYSSRSVLNENFHDLAGLAMMPLGVVLSLALLKFLTLVSTPGKDLAVAATSRSRNGAASAGRWRNGHGKGVHAGNGGYRPSRHRRHKPSPPAVHTPTAKRTAAAALTSPRAVWTGVLAGVVLVVLSGVCYRAVAAAMDAELAREICLPRPLSSLPLVFGPWHGEDVDVSEGVRRIAGNDDYVSRVYHHESTGESVTLYIGYTARPRTMLRHRPEVCYPSAGWTLVGSDERLLDLSPSLSGRGQGEGRLFSGDQAEAPQVPAQLPVRIHRFLKPGLPEQRVVVLSYYVLNGVPTIDEYSFWGLGWRDPNLSRDASRYVAQVQVTTSAGLAPAAAEQVLVRFIEASTAKILQLLPAATSAVSGRQAPAEAT